MPTIDMEIRKGDGFVKKREKMIELYLHLHVDNKTTDCRTKRANGVRIEGGDKGRGLVTA